MANIMASAERVACAAAGLLLTASMTRAADLPVDGYHPLSANDSFILDKDHGSDDYSVFHFAVAEEFGVVSGGFAASDDPRLKPLTRLDSAWNLSAPLISLPMRIGDGVSSADLWSQPARLGGVQIGNYQPATPPVVAPPTMLALPYQQTGPEAPYTTRFMDHLRSVLQWQQAGLTAADQSEFSVESGRLRENFEVRSNDYGPWFTSGTYRYGLNQATTVDAEFAEVAHAQNYLGLGVLEGLGAVGSVSARVASSHDGESYGWLTVLGADYRHDQINLALRSNIQSPAFQDVGDAAVIEPVRQRTLASAGVDLGGLGRISLAGAAQLYTDDSRRDVLALSHAMHFGGGGIISTAAAYSPGPFGNAALLLSFTYPFDAIGRSARTLDRAVASTLDESMVDAFGIPKMPTVGRIALDRPGQPIY